MLLVTVVICFLCLSETLPLGKRINTLAEELMGQKIKMPSLYLHGENDGCIGANLSDGMEIFFEDLQKEILPNCGHFLHLEKPVEVNKIILDFLSS